MVATFTLILWTLVALFEHHVITVHATLPLGTQSPNKFHWYYPFYKQSCIGCPTFGNVLPECVKASVSSLVCTTNPQSLPSCVRIAGSQVVGAVPLAGKALTLASTATVNPSQLKCSPGQSPISLPPCIQLTANNFPDSTLPDGVALSEETINQALQSPNTQVPVSQLTCTQGTQTALPGCAVIAPSQLTSGPLSSGVTINAPQVNGTIAATQLCPAGAANGSITLPSCWSVPGSRITESVAANLVSGILGNGVALNGTIAPTVNITAPQIGGVFSQSNYCPADGSNRTIPSCWNVPGNKIQGPIPGDRIQGTFGPGTELNATIDPSANIDGGAIEGQLSSTVTFQGNLVGESTCASAARCLQISTVTTATPIVGNRYTIDCSPKKILFCPQFLPTNDSSLCAYFPDASTPNICTYGTGCSGADTFPIYATCINF